MTDRWRDQPRVPAGNPDGGQWTAASSAAWKAAGLDRDDKREIVQRLYDDTFDIIGGMPPYIAQHSHATDLSIMYALENYLDNWTGDDSDYREVNIDSFPYELELFYDEWGTFMAALSFWEHPEKEVLVGSNFGSYGRGYGTKAMEWFIQEAISRKKGIQFLSTPAAKGFYRRFGFRKEGIHFTLTYEELKEKFGR